jgi:hypothetical protein
MNYKQFKQDLEKFYKEEYNSELILGEPQGELEAIETQIDGESFATFSLKIMRDNWHPLGLFDDTSFVEYVALVLNKKSSERI